MRNLLILVFLCGLVPAAVAAELTSAERGLVASVDRHHADALELLETLVNQNSGTLNFPGVRAVADLLAPRFAALGFATEWKPGETWNRAGHLLAERPGAPGSTHLLLIGHLDTVFELDSPFQKFTRISETHASGPGTTDMKGGVVVMLLALQALADADALDALTLTVVLTGDEEKPGDPLDLARADLRAAAERADLAIGFEDGDGDPATAVIARRGTTTWRLTTHGTPAHSSQIFREDLGSGAIFEAARILTAFHDELAGEEFLTFSPGVILGGTTVDYDTSTARGTAFGKSNVIAETATVHGDLRAISPEQFERATQTMRRIVSEGLPHTRAELRFTEGYPPLAPTQGNYELLARFTEASLDLGHGPVKPVDPARAGAADISFTAGLVDQAMDGVGLMGDGGHTVNEVADLTTLRVQAERMAVLLYRLALRD